MKMKKNIYIKPLIHIVRFKVSTSIAEDYLVKTSQENEDEQLAKPKDFDDDDFNFEKGGVGEWSSDWSGEWKTAEE